jgi:hypothetical protein
VDSPSRLYLASERLIPTHNTVGCITELIKAALTTNRERPPPRFAYIAPTYAQAKDVAWGYLKHFSSVIPDIQISESELRVEYPNGARIRLYGADNYDRLRGLYHDGVTIDEPAQMNPRAWPEVIRPTLSDYQGWATFIGTPSGQDWFYEIDKNADGTPAADFYRLTLKASDTGIIAPEELESLKAGLTEDQFAREFECSFDAGIVGAYYAAMLAEARNKGRIGPVTADPLLSLRAFHDLGGSSGTADAYSIWIVQWVGDRILILDYYESVGQVLAHHVNWMRKHGYDNAINYLPHDGVRSDAIIGKRYEDHWRDAGFKVEPSVKNQGSGAAMMRVEALRRLGTKLWWNENTTEHGRKAVANYHEKWDDKRRVGLGPDHDWSSHAADALGMMAICYEAPGRDAGFGRKLKYKDQGYA